MACKVGREKRWLEGRGQAILGLGLLVAEMGRGSRDWEHSTLGQSLHCWGQKEKWENLFFSHAFPQEVEHESEAQIGARWPGFDFWLHYLLAV